MVKWLNENLSDKAKQMFHWTTDEDKDGFHIRCKHDNVWTLEQVEGTRWC